MSTELIKNISVSKNKNTISVTSADTSVTPRRYSRRVIKCDKEHPLEERLNVIGTDLFYGMARFLPSCDSIAHEAYIRANDVAKSSDAGGDCNDEDKAKWVSAFTKFVMAGKRDLGKYVVTYDFSPVTVRPRLDDRGNIRGVNYCYGNPKLVSYSFAKEITGYSDEFGMHAIA